MHRFPVEGAQFPLPDIDALDGEPVGRGKFVGPPADLADAEYGGGPVPVEFHEGPGILSFEGHCINGKRGRNI